MVDRRAHQRLRPSFYPPTSRPTEFILDIFAVDPWYAPLGFTDDFRKLLVEQDVASTEDRLPFSWLAGPVYMYRARSYGSLQRLFNFPEKSLSETEIGWGYGWSTTGSFVPRICHPDVCLPTEDTDGDERFRRGIGKTVKWYDTFSHLPPFTERALIVADYFRSLLEDETLFSHLETIAPAMRNLQIMRDLAEIEAHPFRSYLSVAEAITSGIIELDETIAALPSEVESVRNASANAIIAEAYAAAKGTTQNMMSVVLDDQRLEAVCSIPAERLGTTLSDGLTRMAADLSFSGHLYHVRRLSNAIHVVGTLLSTWPSNGRDVNAPTELYRVSKLCASLVSATVDIPDHTLKVPSPPMSATESEEEPETPPSETSDPFLDIQGQEAFVATLRTIPFYAKGNQHLCIAGPEGCSQELGLTLLLKVLREQHQREGKIRYLSGTTLATFDRGYGSLIDRIDASWDKSDDGVLFIRDIDQFLSTKTAQTILEYLRELMSNRTDALVAMTGSTKAVELLKAQNPDLYRRFVHTQVYDYSSHDLAELVVRKLTANGHAVDDEVKKAAYNAIVVHRPSGNFRNMHVSDALANAAIRSARKRKRSTRILPKDIQPTVLQLRPPSVASANDEFNKLIGLETIKSTVTTWIDNFRLTKRRADAGVKLDGIAYHMLFLGPPGTAKTTVARLIGRLMAENNMLSSGHCVEVQRADLIGEYLGQTAPRVVSAFQRAEGGVLFIDEAYSLANKTGHDMYGTEAVDTIVKMMEELREKVVVIAAGYPLPMQDFLNMNPGLASRFTRTFRFPSYDVPTLLDILSYLAEQRGLTITPKARKRVKTMLDGINREDDSFGNGRVMRNLLEHSIEEQAKRITIDSTDEEVTALDAGDFDNSELFEASSAPRGIYGFRTSESS